MTDIVNVERNARVRFPYIAPTVDSEGPMHEVVRVQTQGGKKVRNEGGKVLVALRHLTRAREAIAAIAMANDRSLSMVVGALVDSPLAEQLTRDGLPSAIRPDRGRPSTDTERTINLVVERAGAAERSWTTDIVGEYFDQAYYLDEARIAKLEQLARSLEVTPGQVVDALVDKFLASAFETLSP